MCHSHEVIIHFLICMISDSFSKTETSIAGAVRQQAGKRGQQTQSWLRFSWLLQLPVFSWGTRCRQHSPLSLLWSVRSHPAPIHVRNGGLTQVVFPFIQSIHILERTASSGTEPSVSRQLLEPEPVPLSKVSDGTRCSLRWLEVSPGPAEL